MGSWHGHYTDSMSLLPHLHWPSSQWQEYRHLLLLQRVIQKSSSSTHFSQVTLEILFVNVFLHHSSRQSLGQSNTNFPLHDSSISIAAAVIIKVYRATHKGKHAYGLRAHKGSFMASHFFLRLAINSGQVGWKFVRAKWSTTRIKCACLEYHLGMLIWRVIVGISWLFLLALAHFSKKVDKTTIHQHIVNINNNVSSDFDTAHHDRPL